MPFRLIMRPHVHEISCFHDNPSPSPASTRSSSLLLREATHSSARLELRPVAMMELDGSEKLILALQLEPPTAACRIHLVVTLPRKDEPLLWPGAHEVSVEPAADEAELERAEV